MKIHPKILQINKGKRKIIPHIQQKLSITPPAVTLVVVAIVLAVVAATAISMITNKMLYKIF